MQHIWAAESRHGCGHRHRIFQLLKRIVILFLQIIFIFRNSRFRTPRCGGLISGPIFDLNPPRELGFQDCVRLLQVAEESPSSGGDRRRRAFLNSNWKEKVNHNLLKCKWNEAHTVSH
ncbi:unnamed protein product [Musa hybrid cultivar]